MSAMVFFMLISSTANVILSLEFFIVQVPTIGVETSPDVMRKLTACDISSIWLARFNVGILVQVGMLRYANLYPVLS